MINKKGMTLIELTLAISIGLIILELLLSLYLILFKIWDEQFAINKLNNTYMTLAQKVEEDNIILTEMEPIVYEGVTFSIELVHLFPQKSFYKLTGEKTIANKVYYFKRYWLATP